MRNFSRLVSRAVFLVFPEQFFWVFPCENGGTWRCRSLVVQEESGEGICRPAQAYLGIFGGNVLIFWYVLIRFVDRSFDRLSHHDFPPTRWLNCSDNPVRGAKPDPWVSTDLRQPWVVRSVSQATWATSTPFAWLPWPDNLIAGTSMRRTRG